MCSRIMLFVMHYIIVLRVTLTGFIVPLIKANKSQTETQRAYDKITKCCDKSGTKQNITFLKSS